MGAALGSGNTEVLGGGEGVEAPGGEEEQLGRQRPRRAQPGGGWRLLGAILGCLQLRDPVGEPPVGRVPGGLHEKQREEDGESHAPAHGPPVGTVHMEGHGALLLAFLLPQLARCALLHLQPLLCLLWVLHGPGCGWVRLLSILSPGSGGSLYQWQDLRGRPWKAAGEIRRGLFGVQSMCF